MAGASPFVVGDQGSKFGIAVVVLIEARRGHCDLAVIKFRLRVRQFHTDGIANRATAFGDIGGTFRHVAVAKSRRYAGNDDAAIAGAIRNFCHGGLPLRRIQLLLDEPLRTNEADLHHHVSGSFICRCNASWASADPLISLLASCPASLPASVAGDHWGGASMPHTAITPTMIAPLPTVVRSRDHIFVDPLLVAGAAPKPPKA